MKRTLILTYQLALILGWNAVDTALNQSKIVSKSGLDVSNKLLTSTSRRSPKRSVDTFYIVTQPASRPMANSSPLRKHKLSIAKWEIIKISPQFVKSLLIIRYTAVSFQH